MTDQVAGLENARKCPAIWSVIFKSCKFSTHPHFSLLELFFLSENFFCENTKFGAKNPQFGENSGAKFKHPHDVLCRKIATFCRDFLAYDTGFL